MKKDEVFTTLKNLFDAKLDSDKPYEAEQVLSEIKQINIYNDKEKEPLIKHCEAALKEKKEAMLIQEAVKAGMDSMFILGMARRAENLGQNILTQQSIEEAIQQMQAHKNQAMQGAAQWDYLNQQRVKKFP